MRKIYSVDKLPVVRLEFVILSNMEIRNDEIPELLNRFMRHNVQLGGGELGYFSPILRNTMSDTWLNATYCSECGRKYLTFRYASFRGNYPFHAMCPDCAVERGAHKDSPVCDVCGLAILDEPVEMGDLLVHEACVESVARCDRCGSPEVELFTVYTSYGEEYWCEDCADNYSSVCDSCGDSIFIDDLFPVNNGNSYYCRECADNYAHTCEACGELFTEGWLTYVESEDAVFCDSCLNRLDLTPSGRAIPIDVPIIIPAPRHGVEIEAADWNVGIRPNSYHSRRLVGDPFPENTRFESDASLVGDNPGEAIMAEPSNNLAWSAVWLQEVLSLIRATNRSCGMHVHLTVDDADAYIGKFYTVEDLAFALNGSDAWIRKDSTYSFPIKRKREFGHYSSISRISKTHIEVRAFYAPDTLIEALAKLAFVVALEKVDVDDFRDLPYRHLAEILIKDFGWARDGKWIGWPNVGRIHYIFGDEENVVEIPSVEKRMRFIASALEYGVAEGLGKYYAEQNNLEVRL